MGSASSKNPGLSFRWFLTIVAAVLIGLLTVGGATATAMDETGSVPGNVGIGDANPPVNQPAEAIVTVCTQPALSLSQVQVYWGSYADYTVGILSDDFRIDNAGSEDAYTVFVHGTINTGNVTAVNLPINLNTIAAGGNAVFTMQYQIPETLASGSMFRSTIYLLASDSCGNFYNYPGPYPGPCG